jgi:cytochrome b561
MTRAESENPRITAPPSPSNKVLVFLAFLVFYLCRELLFIITFIKFTILRLNAIEYFLKV